MKTGDIPFQINFCKLLVIILQILCFQFKFRATVSLANASDEDFSLLSSTDLYFGAGNTEETIAIATYDDSIAEDDEIFMVTLSTTSPNVQIDKFKGVTTVTIQDNNGTSGIVLLRKHSHDIRACA